MDPLDAALLHAWDTHVVPRLATPHGRATLAARVRSLQPFPRAAASSLRVPSPPRGDDAAASTTPLRAFALTLRANDRRLPDNNAQGLVVLTPDTLEKYCAPIHLPPPGVPRQTAADLLGISPQALTARVRTDQLRKHQPQPTARRPRQYKPGPYERPTPNTFYYAPPPHHLIHPAGDLKTADWGTLNQTLHLRPRNLPRPRNMTPSACGLQSACPPTNSRGAANSAGGTWSQTLQRTLRQLRPQNPTPQYLRFEWRCPDCQQFAQRLHWPFRPLTLPAYLSFNFQQLAPELAPDQIKNLQSKIKNSHLPFTPGFTCRKCLKKQFGAPPGSHGLTYESSEFTSHHGPRKSKAGNPLPAIPRNTWHLFIQRLTLNLLRGDEVQYPPH